MLFWEGILFLTGFFFLAAASYTDLKKREVPDWLSYGLIFSGLGLRLIFSFEEGWGIFLNGLLGFGVCWGIAYLLYMANSWGGGDSKLLMGMGGVIGLGANFKELSFSSFDFSLFWFFLGLLLFGAIGGIVWSLRLALKERKKVKEGLKNLLSSIKKSQYLVWLVSGSLLILGFFYSYFWLIGGVILGGFYLICLVKVVEECCFIKEIEVDKLVEGDWLTEDVFVDKKKIASKKKGLEKKEIWQLKELWGEGKLKKVLVKEGIPFVPSFLLSYILVAGLGLFKGVNFGF